ncbi:MAG: patatin family protein [Erysipelotrichaceae bacterium]|nr:patatin family protein [Erysipelotrichaceae bacterium]
MGRNMKKTSLVLEGGGLRGAFTAGALAWLIDNDISFDNAYGISTGAVYLANYLIKDKQKLFDISTKYINDKRDIGIRPLLRTGRLVDYDDLFYRGLRDFLGFDMDLVNKVKKPYSQIGLYELEQGKTVYKDFSKCSLDELKASTSLPIIGKITECEGRHILDGGITDMIPIEKSVEDGCDRHLIITTKPYDYVRKPAKEFVIWLMKKTYPMCENISEDYRVRHINYQKQIGLIKELEEKGRAVYIYPTKTSKVSRLGGTCEQLAELYELGYQDMENRREEILSLFGK